MTTQIDLLSVQNFLPIEISDQNPIGVLDGKVENIGNFLQRLGQKIVDNSPNHGVVWIPDAFTAINLLSSMRHRNIETPYDLKRFYISYLEKLEIMYGFCGNAAKTKGKCTLCEEDDVNIITSTDCTHGGCEKCWRKQIHADIKEKRSPLPRCVGCTNGCNRFVNEAFARGISEELFNGLQKLQIDVFLNSSATRHGCTKIYFSPVLYSDRQKLISFECVDCSRRKCFVCRRYTHLPLPCSLIDYFNKLVKMNFPIGSITRIESTLLKDDLPRKDLEMNKDGFSFFNEGSRIRRKNFEVELDLKKSSLTNAPKQLVDCFINYTYFSSLAEGDFSRFVYEGSPRSTKKLHRDRFFALKFLANVYVLKYFIVAGPHPQDFPVLALKGLFGEDCGRSLFHKDSLADYNLKELHRTAMTTITHKKDFQSENMGFMKEKMKSLYGSITDKLSSPRLFPSWKEYSLAPTPHPIFIGEEAQSFIPLSRIVRRDGLFVYLEKVADARYRKDAGIPDPVKENKGGSGGIYRGEKNTIERSRMEYEAQLLRMAKERSLMDHPIKDEEVEGEQQQFLDPSSGGAQAEKITPRTQMVLKISEDTKAEEDTKRALELSKKEHEEGLLVGDDYGENKKNAEGTEEDTT